MERQNLERQKIYGLSAGWFGVELVSEYRGAIMGLAMLWVMLFHAYQFQFQITILDVLKEYGFLGVDVFILLSGMGLCRSLLDHEGQTRVAFYRKRLQRVLPAYWIVVGIYSLYLFISQKISLSTIFWNVSTLYYWFHIPDCFNWYIPAILVFYLIAPYYVTALKKSKYKEAITLLSFVCSYLVYRLAITINLDYMVDFIFRIPAFAVGILAGFYLVEKTPFSAILSRYAIPSLICGLFLLFLKRSAVFYIHPCYIFNLFNLTLCLIIGFILSKMGKNILNRFLALIGSYTLEIYLLNVVITREYFTFCSTISLMQRNVVFAYAILYCANLLGAIGLKKITQYF